MRAEKVTYAVLSGAAGITAIVGTRIFGGGLPQGQALPALAYELISDVPVRTLNGLAGSNMWEARIQATAFDDDYAGVKSLLEQVLASMEFKSGPIAGITVVAVIPDITGPDLRDDDNGFFYQSRDFLITYQQ